MATGDDTGIGGHWEWGVIYPTLRGGPLDRCFSYPREKDGGEAEAREEYEGLLENNRRFPETAFTVKLVKRWVPNWTEVK